MGQYRGRDLLRVPGLLSLARVPLAIGFPAVAHEPKLAFSVLALAAATDVLDGWYARRFHQVTATGALVDPLTDKLFVLSVAITLVAQGHLPIGGVLMLAVRELGELPLIAVLLMVRSLRRTHAAQPEANGPGKVATLMQFIAVTAALFSLPFVALLLRLTAAAGAIAAASYWWRALSGRRGRSSSALCASERTHPSAPGG